MELSWEKVGHRSQGDEGMRGELEAKGPQEAFWRRAERVLAWTRVGMCAPAAVVASCRSKCQRTEAKCSVEVQSSS